MNNYNWFENHEGDLGFTVRHTEGDVETLIAVTDTAEKAHLIVTMLNNTPRDGSEKPEELLKPYRKQSRNGVLDWVSHEDAVKVLAREMLQFLLLKQLYDGAIQQWKDADEEAKMLKKAICTYDDMIKEFTEEIHRLKKWKEEQLASTPDMQALAKVMNVPLGETVHDKIIPYIKALKERNAELENENFEDNIGDQFEES